MDVKTSFEEIRALFSQFPSRNVTGEARARKRWRSLVKPVGSLGALELAIETCAAWQDGGPHLDHACLQVFAGNHGVYQQGVSAYPQSVTKAMVDVMQNKRAAISVLAKHYDCSLKLCEMHLEKPVQDCSKGAALEEHEAAHAICYGMLQIEQGVDCVGLGEVGIANTTAAAALTALHFPEHDPADFVGRGAGLNDDQWQHKISVVKKIVARHQGLQGLAALGAVGGREMNAIAGAIIAARMARCIVILDGYTVGSVALALFAESSSALDHCLAGHRSAEPGHDRILSTLDKEPLLDLGMYLGEGTGAAFAIGLLRGALSCYNNMGLLQDVVS